MRAHLVNCTYCAHRKTFAPVVKKKKEPEIETCVLTGHKIPEPRQPGRFCEKFHQVEHDESCKCYVPIEIDY